MVGRGLLKSVRKRDRSYLIRQTAEHHLRQTEAADRLGMSVRPFKRLVRSSKRVGDARLVSRQRGQALHNRETVRQMQVALAPRGHSDFALTSRINW